MKVYSLVAWWLGAFSVGLAFWILFIWALA